MKKKYRYLFFDLDHTLWDFKSNSRAVLRILYQDFHLGEKGIPDLLSFQTQFEIQNEKFWERFRKGYISREDLRLKRFWHLLLFFKIPDIELAKTLGTAFPELLPQQKILLPYVKEVLEYCYQKGYQMSLITNGFESVQKMKLTNAGIEHYFLHLITSQNCGFLKPNREIFDFAIQVANADLAQSLMVGDAIEADILGAQNIGMDQVFYNPTQKIHAETPTYEISDWKELEEIL